jgi:hypothetical protein
MPTPSGPQFHKIVREWPENTYTQNLSESILVSNSPKRVRTTYAHTTPINNRDKITSFLATQYDAPYNETVYPKDYEYNEKWANRTAQPDGQVPLFQYYSDPATNKVEHLESTQRDRVAATTLLGIADRESQIAGHGPITPSNDLSKYSLQMVKHLERKGATKTPDNLRSNNMNFMKEEFASVIDKNDFTPIPDDAVKAGRNRVRDALRTPKPQVTGKQEQLFEDNPLYGWFEN